MDEITTWTTHIIDQSIMVLYSSYDKALNTAELLPKHIPVFAPQSLQNERDKFKKVSKKLESKKIDQSTIYFYVGYC